MLPWELPIAWVVGEGDYWLVRWLFKRGLAVIYLLAFLVAATQFRPLCGEDGLLPLERYRERTTFRRRPSLLYVLPSDRVAGIMAWLGVGLSLAALVGVDGTIPGASVGTAIASATLWGTMWLLYLSFVNAGQTFYGFGWETMLLETGFLTIFLGAGEIATPVAVIWLLRWVLFRNMFGAGLIKIRGDECWRNLTAMDYHYETQPMPNPLSWFAHHLPDRFHRVEVLGNHVVELLVPFLYFLPQPFAAIGGVATIGFQLWLMLTGNFSWLNALTIVLAISTFSDPLLTGPLAGIVPISTPATVGIPSVLASAVVLLVSVVLVLSIRPTLNMLSPNQVMNASFDPLHLVNTYGAFGSITRERYEIVIQGTHDATITDDTEWRTYLFKGKPTDPGRRPPQWAPYHLRLDWQLWFAAMSSPRMHPWFDRLLTKLLTGDEATLSLLRTNPFPETPPEHVRAVRYRYRFTTPTERRETSQWWHRERADTYVRPVSLDDWRLRSRR